MVLSAKSKEGSNVLKIMFGAFNELVDKYGMLCNHNIHFEALFKK